MDAPDKPSSPKPAQPPTPSGAYISPKLREKLMESGDTKEWSPKGPSPLPWIIGLIVVLAAGAFGITAMRSAAAKRQATERAAALKATADSLVAVAQAESVATVAADSTRRADSLAVIANHGRKPTKPAPAVATTTGAKPASGAASTASAAGAKPAAAPKVEAGPFGIAVGSFLFEDKANTEKDALAGKTGLTGSVGAVKEGGADVYRVVLGSFPTRAAAQAKADELTNQGAIEQARVVPLPK